MGLLSGLARGVVSRAVVAAKSSARKFDVNRAVRQVKIYAAPEREIREGARAFSSYGKQILRKLAAKKSATKVRRVSGLSSEIHYVNEAEADRALWSLNPKYGEEGGPSKNRRFFNLWDDNGLDLKRDGRKIRIRQAYAWNDDV